MKALQFLASFPLKTTLALVFLSYLIVRYTPPPDEPEAPKTLTIQYGMNPDLLETAEFYPLSSFRMYSKFSPNPNYVYITDGDDTPIAHHNFGALSSAIKKDFDRRLRKIKKKTKVQLRKMTPEQKTPAGNETLHHVVANTPAGNRPKITAKTLRLYEVTLTLAEGGGVQESTKKVGEITP